MPPAEILQFAHENLLVIMLNSQAIFLVGTTSILNGLLLLFLLRKPKISIIPVMLQ
jgi:hypothetical protein